mmetsp:Transcript_8311/g.9079  ORF Transcript_8311/g.9079 Transcript_8311/m.9079 type:complete len:569 (+) Transcript_8311:169-1875(+)|eukprot:CAMPEP_0173149542 /NCGR_PEP_ID=MMETSP1105-20130129/10388_1 /TAXON_ID=2985 /ORGANISM="Ochromonas sp., Strain BG-1" /LENGTH=568 /DNA_ID=CAMNT_0014064429 /DNA_START=164 /DNA_END=1870 /DNA_ORIENTATION=-
MFDPDELSLSNQDGYPDDLQLGDDDLDDILNSLMDEANASSLNIKNENNANKSSLSNSSSKRGSSTGSNKKRKFNPDAEKIAEVTEAALRSLDIDPNSQDAKKKRRQIRNRLSAQFHRDRKNAYIKQLEDASDASKKLIESLQKRIYELEQENVFLKDQLGVYHPTMRSGSTGSTTAASDSEISSTGSSPLHEPQYHNTGLNSIREITTNRGTSLPIPMAKTLSLLSVLCILCMTYLEHPIKVEPSSKVDMSPRRRLEAPPTIDEAFVFPAVNNTEPFLHNNNYLRGSKTMENNTANLSNPRIIYTSNALIPFDLPYQYQNDWYARKEPFDALSYSHIIMNSGVALFDPSMKFKRAHSLHHHHQHLKDTNPLAVVPTITHNPFEGDEFYDRDDLIIAQQRSNNVHQLPQLDYDPTKAVMMDVNESKEDNEIEEKNWPAITALPPAPIHSFVPRSLDAPNVIDCARCPQDETLLLAKLLEQANLVTVTVPASSVRVGKNVQDSEDGTVEGIMEMFNLTSDTTTTATTGDRNHTTATATVFQNSLNDASVEINCIILSAKLIMNSSPPKH